MNIRLFAGLTLLCAIANPIAAKSGHTRHWTKSIIKDEINDSKRLSFATTALVSGTSNEAVLVVGCSRSDLVSVNVYFEHMVLEDVRDGKLLVRFDKDEPGYLPWSRGDDYKSLSSDDPRVLVRDYLLGSDIFRMEFKEYPGTYRTLTFHVAGLEPLIHGHCGL